MRTQVAFRAELSQNSESFVLLDDVSVKTGACSQAGTCDFESGKCTWVNVANGFTDEHDWIHADGHYSGPPFDYTTHTADGEDWRKNVRLNLPDLLNSCSSYVCG